MTALLTLLILLGVGALVALVLVRHAASERWRGELVAYRLRFPRGLDAASVTAFLTGLSGLVAPRWRRPVDARAVVLEVAATEAGIVHRLLVPRPLAPVVLSALRAALPSVSALPEPIVEPLRYVLAAELGLVTEQRPLRLDAPQEVGAAILASLLPLRASERVVVQLAVMPVGPSSPVEDSQPTSMRVPAKQASALFLASVRLGVAAERARSRSLLARLLAAFHAANAPGAHLRRRLLPSWWVARLVRERRLPLLRRACLLNARELTGLVAFPLGELSLPGLDLGGCRQLAPSAAIRSEGRVIATATFPGAERPLALSVADSLRHLHVIGPTGAGKSTLLLNLISQDLQRGAGVVVVDPKADLVGDVLDRVPPERAGDVVLLDPSDAARPVGLNLLAGAADEPELVVDQVVGTLHNLFRSSWGPRTDDILRAALLTLVTEPGMTLCEIPLLLTDASFRRRLVGRLDDPVALGPFWGWYEGISEAERAQAIGPVMNKLRAILLRERLRNVVGQREPAFALDRAVDEGRIVLVALSKGLLGEEAAALLGSLLIAQLWQVVQRRAALSAAARRPLFLYVDEVQDYLHLPTSLADVLAQARGLGLGLTLAHQHLGQLPPPLRQALLANARSRVIFQAGADDARALARELAPHLGASDLQGLGPHEVVATLSVDARVAPPTTGRTLPPPPALGQAALVRAASRAQYGRPAAEVAAAIRARHAGRPVDGGLGRQRRTP
ncbi:MAG: type IV secretory system conjugative DNA transfer family protein [Frankiaceae bacterium]